METNSKMDREKHRVLPFALAISTKAEIMSKMNLYFLFLLDDTEAD